jgi:FMN phosphatase YigB (HAD superfamily)
LAVRLADFDALTFDCYGTLIDWESGIVTALQSLLARVTQPPTRDAVLESFARHRDAAREGQSANAVP